MLQRKFSDIPTVTLLETINRELRIGHGELGNGKLI